MRRFAVIAALAAACLPGCVPPPPPVLPTAAMPYPAYGLMPLPAGTPPPRSELVQLPPGSVPGEPNPPSVLRLAFAERVFFEFDGYLPRLEAAPVLDAFAAAMKADPAGAVVTVLGHTDNIGTDTYNLGLSRRRAQSVLDELLTRRVPPARLAAVAVGKRQPVASNATPEGRAENRRVEFLVSGSAAANLAAAAQRTAGREPLEALIPSPAPGGGVVLDRQPLMVRAPIPTPSPVPPTSPAVRRAARRPAPVRPAAPAPAPPVQPARPDDVGRAPLGESMEY